MSLDNGATEPNNSSDFQNNIKNDSYIVTTGDTVVHLQETSRDITIKTIVDAVSQSITQNKDFQGHKVLTAVYEYVWSTDVLRYPIFFLNLFVIIYVIYVFVYKGIYRFFLYGKKHTKRWFKRKQKEHNWESSLLGNTYKEINACCQRNAICCGARVRVPDIYEAPIFFTASNQSCKLQRKSFINNTSEPNIHTDLNKIDASYKVAGGEEFELKELLSSSTALSTDISTSMTIPDRGKTSYIVESESFTQKDSDMASNSSPASNREQKKTICKNIDLDNIPPENSNTQALNNSKNWRKLWDMDDL
ncbi:hypothetical protein CDIK_1911 [Cucumispora dikerogammari]|nr:hypothetical protein CDIK_1911 [Cucumispora dikerogammari]